MRLIGVYRGKPVIYGCGDFINDYEGIGDNGRYRGELGHALRAVGTCIGKTRRRAAAADPDEAIQGEPCSGTMVKPDRDGLMLRW